MTVVTSKVRRLSLVWLHSYGCEQEMCGSQQRREVEKVAEEDQQQTRRSVVDEDSGAQTRISPKVVACVRFLPHENLQVQSSTMRLLDRLGGDRSALESVVDQVSRFNPVFACNSPFPLPFSCILFLFLNFNRTVWCKKLIGTPLVAYGCRCCVVRLSSNRHAVVPWMPSPPCAQLHFM